MYTNNTHPDPYAGQYPPPPPLQDTEHNSSVSIPMQQPYIPPIQQPATYTPTESYPPPPQQYAYVPPIHQYPSGDVYSPPPQRNEFYGQPQPQPYYNAHTPLDEERHLTGVNDYPQHRDNSLDDYLRQERAEYLKHESNTIPLHNEPKQNQITPYYNKEDADDEKEKTPMVLKESAPPSRKERKRIEKLKKQHGDAMYAAYVTKPTLAPENEAESYRPKPYVEESKSGCNCCCYNPAITCCSFFCLLISVAFLAAGVAMMIASKVVTDKCNSQCGNVIDQAQQACGTLCSKVLHDGMLYGGAVVAGLAGIAIIWKIIMWTCAGYSKR